MQIDIVNIEGKKVGQARPRRRRLRRQGEGIPPLGGGQGAARRARAPARTRPRSATRCAAAARSRTSRRAPAARARARPGRPSSSAAARCAGPQPRDYSYTVPQEGAARRARVARCRCAPRRRSWSSSTAFAFAAPKTKTLAGILKALGAEKAWSSTARRNVNLSKSARNLPTSKSCRPRASTSTTSSTTRPRDRRRRRQGDRGARAWRAGRAEGRVRSSHAFTRTDHQAPAAHREGDAPQGHRRSRRSELDPETLKSQLLFEVAATPTRSRFAHAVEKLWNVDVVAVRTSIVRGKEKRMGRFVGKRSNWKKAIVTIAAGQTVEFFEGV